MMASKKDIVSEERSNNSTLNMVFLIQALKNYSEEDPITLKEIANRCDFCSPYTIRNLLDALYRRTNPKSKSLDFRLIKYVRERDTGKYIEWNNDLINSGETYYYKIEFDVKKSEIKLLTDAISMFPFLSPEQTIKLINSLEKMSSVPDLSDFKKIMREYDYKAQMDKGIRQSYSSSEFFKTIETVTKAIAMGKCIKFDYYMYASNPEKTRLVFSKRSEKTFHPGFFIWSNGFYYLVGKEEGRTDWNFSNLRVDRIQNVEICKNLEIYDMGYINSAKYRDENPVMYGGSTEKVVFRVKEFLLNAVVDSFGRNIKIKPTDFTDSDYNEYVIVEANSSIDGATMWLTEYCNHATALGPEGLVDKVKGILSEGLRLYE